MRLQALIFIVFLLGAITSCREKYNLRVNHDDIDYIELVWVEHHYHNETPDHFKLPEDKMQAFMDDFEHAHEIDSPNKNTCFEIVFYLKNGDYLNYASNGRFLLDIRHGSYFEFGTKQNLITKYWGLHERDHCLKD